MWGILIPCPMDGRKTRFIPTHVGNTHETGTQSWMEPVHPHTCGEYKVMIAIPPLVYGSSPHMWGILIVGTNDAQQLRFIPTHVGNTALTATSLTFSAVHPHTCGEYLSTCPALEEQCGSSPHMWGILGRSYPVSPCWRFIPTHVGNTKSAAFIIRHSTVHPHTCGEYPKNMYSTFHRIWQSQSFVFCGLLNNSIPSKFSTDFVGSPLILILYDCSVFAE